jgi:hypothetical protein
LQQLSLVSLSSLSRLSLKHADTWLFSLSGTLTLLVSLKHAHTCSSCLSGSLTPAFGKCIEANQTWVPILEKAYAKLHGASSLSLL